jgi:hypothetical protein
MGQGHFGLQAFYGSVPILTSRTHGSFFINYTSGLWSAMGGAIATCSVEHMAAYLLEAFVWPSVLAIQVARKDVQTEGCGVAVLAHLR